MANKKIMILNRISFAGLILVAAILACSIPTAVPQQTAPEIQTAAALTLEEILTIPSSSPTLQQSATPNTPSPTGSTSPQKETITPTYSVPMLTVREQTNCRTGPGQDYEIVFTYLAGKKLEIAGRYDPDNYWLVKSAETPTGVCWLWGEYVEVTGSYWAVSSVTPPPTATIAPPQAPSIQEWNYSCSGDTLTFIVEWTDKAINEAGYRVYRNGDPIVELAANSTTYAESIALLSGETVEYYIQVYGPSGSENSSIMKMSC